MKETVGKYIIKYWPWEHLQARHELLRWELQSKKRNKLELQLNLKKNQRYKWIGFKREEYRRRQRGGRHQDRTCLIDLCWSYSSWWKSKTLENWERKGGKGVEERDGSRQWFSHSLYLLSLVSRSTGVVGWLYGEDSYWFHALLRACM